MKISSLLLLALALPVPLAAQQTPTAPDSTAAALEDQVPPRLAAVETARSRRCVPELATLASLNDDLAPLADRADRIRTMARAITMEDTTGVTPFQGSDPLEKAVAQWFASDGALAKKWANTGDTAIARQRRDAKSAILKHLSETLDSLNTRANARIGQAGDVDAASQDCEDAILVRSAVLEVCDTTASPVCAAAKAPAGAAAQEQQRFRFVDKPEDLWDVESLRPWTSPGPLSVAPDGSITGARTGALARRGNVVAVVGLQPMIRPRSSVTDAQAKGFDANLDSLGFSFQSSRFIMAPVIMLQLDVAGPLAGETDYILHFGDLSDPGDQVVWSTEAKAEGGPYTAAIPASKKTLARLAQGQPLRLTAARISKGGDSPQGEPVYSLAITPVNQAQAVSSLLQYMGGGALARDLSAMAPPTPTDSASGTGHH